MVIIQTQQAKKMNKPNLNVHSICMKISAMKNVKIMLTATLILCAADRISSGKISLGTNQPRGPHDQANPATYTLIALTRIVAYHLGNTPGFPSVPNLSAIATDTITYKMYTQKYSKYIFKNVIMYLNNLDLN